MEGRWERQVRFAERFAERFVRNLEGEPRCPARDVVVQIPRDPLDPYQPF
jgi:hypothetical protein